MQQLSIGVLLVSIIVIAGWLIFFYNKMANMRIIVDDSWNQLDFYLQKRKELSLKVDVDYSQVEHQLEELEEKIEVNCYIFNEHLIKYNKYVTVFPGKAAGIILGLKELPYFHLTD